MIGKPEWFTYRIFGWGLRPKTWQGWAYTAALAMILGAVTAVTTVRPEYRWTLLAVLAIVFIDVIHIMTKLPKMHDERDNYHQLIIERNCSLAAIVALAGIAVYQAAANMGKVDTSILIVLGAMVLTKAASYAYVKWKM